MTIRRIQRGRNHGYTINGEKAIGVTTAMSKGLPKPALVNWAARCAAEEAVDFFLDPATRLRLDRDALVTRFKYAHVRQRDEAAVRGTKVHHYAEQLIRGKPVEVPDELAGHVEAALKFMDQWKVKPLLVERTVGSYRWGYAGTFDLIGELPDGRRVLFDYKTGKSGIWPDTALQLAAYRHADAYVAEDGTEIPMAEVGITEAKAVWVRADGYDVIPLNTDASVFKAFLHMLQVAKALDVWEAWRGDAEQPVNA